MNWDDKNIVQTVTMTKTRWKMFLVLSSLIGVMSGIIITTWTICS